ncbi:hypothetical protein [Streptomyces sp. NPDC088794]|uniref:hypothetical protein n=1 Tax=Streptomyces sp. NPDC088794 TaxID=3365902 RepID=UPI0038074301
MGPLWKLLHNANDQYWELVKWSADEPYRPARVIAILLATAVIISALVCLVIVASRHFA